MDSVKSRNLRRTALGGITNNPIFVLVLGMCPTIAVSTTLINGISMGLATTLVLVISNTLISLTRKLIPDKIRIPCYILIIATFVTVLDLGMQKWLPGLSGSLGLFIPLIVVNCIILGRAEAFASTHDAVSSAVDGASMGLGFTLSISLLGLLRELLTYGGIVLTSPVEDVVAADRASALPIFGTAAGGFLTLAVLMAAFNAVYGYFKERNGVTRVKVSPEAAKEASGGAGN